MKTPKLSHIRQFSKSAYFPLLEVFWSGMIKKDLKTREEYLAFAEQLVIRMKESQARAFDPELSEDKREQARRVEQTLKIMFRALRPWLKSPKKNEDSMDKNEFGNRPAL